METKEEKNPSMSMGNSSGGYKSSEAQKTMDMAQRLAKQMGIKI